RRGVGPETPQVFGVHAGDTGGEGEHAAAGGDGLRGVDDEVHDHLSELRGIGADGGQAGGEVEAQDAVLCDGDLQQVGGVLDELVEVEALDHEPVLAGVGEHLLAEVGGAA